MYRTNRIHLLFYQGILKVIEVVRKKGNKIFLNRVKI